MIRSKAAFVLAQVLAVTLLASPSAHGASPLNGVYEMKMEEVKKNGSVLCGRFYQSNGSSLYKPGRWVSKAPKSGQSALFIHTEVEAKNYLAMSKAKKYSKAKKKSYAKKAKSLKNLAATNAPKCKNINALKFSSAVANTTGIAIRSIPNSNFSLSLPSGTSSPSSNVFTIDANGGLQQAILNGYPEARLSRVAPDGSLYIAFQDRVNLLDVTEGVGELGVANTCSLIRIPQGSTTPSCVDTNIYSVQEIQFNSSGIMVYLADGELGSIVKKRATNGAISSVTSTVGGMNIGRLKLLANGEVLVGGSTESNGLDWVKLYKNDGTNKNLISNYAYFMESFPDGKTYIGAENQNGVKVFDPDLRTIESTYYMSGADLTEPDPQAATFYTSTMCNETYIPGMCNDGGAVARNFSTLSGEKVFALTGTSGDDTAVVQYYPSTEIRQIDVSDVMSRPTLMVAAGDKLAVAGVTSDNTNVLYLLDPSTGQKTVVRSSANDFETYHIKYRAASGELLFDGLKSDNTFVLVRLNLSTGVQTEKTVGSIRLLDFDVR
jgi:hypothetical protein